MAVISIDQNGKITALGVGTARVKVTTADGNFTAYCTVNVSALKVTGVSLSKSIMSVPMNSTETLLVTVQPANATNKNVTWKSDNPSIATVSDFGLVTPIALGTTIISVTTEDGSKTASCEVTVVPIGVTGITLDKTTIDLIDGESATLVATVAPDEASNKNVTWEIE